MHSEPIYVLLFVTAVTLMPDAATADPHRAVAGSEREISIRLRAEPASKPYYFGETDLSCMMGKGKKGRRRRGAPWRVPIKWSHRWILYDGVYFEFGIPSGGDMKTRYGSSPAGINQCDTEREANPAGYSRLPVNCIKACTNRYVQNTGSYNLVSNNCHNFANFISEVLYNNRCPSWCT